MNRQPTGTPPKKRAMLHKAGADLDQQAFDALAANAFEFLSRSSAEFAESPKFSIIHFCAGLEMLLKARLMREHWSLIVSKPEQAHRQAFLDGAFVSVTLEQTWSRLRDIVGLPLNESAQKAFNEVSKHRNMAIHFFHSGLEKNDKTLEKIVIQQGQAWFHLHRLLSAWPEFEAYREEIEATERSLRGHRKYLVGKFEVLKPELDILKKQGHSLMACRVCDFEAAIASQFDQYLFDLECKVCDHQEIVVELKCPSCHNDTLLGADRICQACGLEVGTDELVDAFVDAGDAHRAAMEGDCHYGMANCHACDGHFSAFVCGDRYLCSECFDVVESVEVCQWCNEPNTGDMEDSYWAGCNFCDGAAGHHRDED